VPPNTAPRLLAIGEFARQTRLTAKALRIHDEIGLLRPTDVDPGSGRRRYEVRQIRPARLIAMLRGADLGLAEIGLLLAERDQDRELAVARLDQHLNALEKRHASRRWLVRHVRALLRAPETDTFVREAKAAFAAHLAGAPPAGPFTLIFHGVVDHESDGPVEAVLPCPAGTQASDLVGIRTEPAHDEAFTTITKAQWDYPAILAAYDAVACSPQAADRPRSPLSCREVYLAEPDAVGEADLICDIAFPLG
jgi:DNA-binding transcriptional MerR regulator